MALQKTRIQKIQAKILGYLSITFSGPWKTRCLGLLSLLSGYYLSTNLISYWINNNTQRITILITFLIMIEFIIRFRPRSFNRRYFLRLWIVIDNLRIGTTYAIALEAFKLGS